MTGLMADGPGDPYKLAAVYFLFLAWPVLVVLAVIAGWCAYRFHRIKLGWACMAAPALWPVVPLLAYTILVGRP